MKYIRKRAKSYDYFHTYYTYENAQGGWAPAGLALNYMKIYENIRNTRNIGNMRNI